MKICLSCEGVTNTAAQRCGHCGAFLLGTDSVHYPDRRGEADAGNPLLGSVVDGKYRLQGVLGRGGLGTVFQAVHIGSLMPVAVKLLHPRFSERAEYRRALIPEARRAATVTNEHCCRMLDVGEAEDGVAYLAMELVDGDTLDVLVRGGALAPSHALLVLTQVAEALVAIHAAGLVHCDLSPRNVMVSVRDGELRVKVLDFGIARTATMAGAERARPGEFAGFVNPAFAAPEHLSGQDVDPRADLYSFGMLAWLLLTGSLPIDDSDPARAARAIVAGELRPWPNVPGVPRRLQRLIVSCLRRDRQARPPSADAVLRELVLVHALRRPALGGASVLALAAAAMAAIVASLDVQPPFLRSVVGSHLILVDRLPSAVSDVQHLRSSRLDTLQFHFGGFAADRLRVDLSSGGTVVLQKQLLPVVDAAGDTLTLATAQSQWRDVVQGLLSRSRDGAVDVSFVVPGAAPLGCARVRLDDEPPTVVWSTAIDETDVLTGTTKITWQAEDAIEVERAEVQVAWRDRNLALPLTGKGGEFALGEALAGRLTAGSELGACEVAVVAYDRARNESPRSARSFARCDLRAPEVTEVTGPAGEPQVPCGGGVARLRVRTSAPEPGCTLRLEGADGRELARVPLAGPGTWHQIEVRCDGSDKTLVAGPVDFVITDEVGNRTSHTFTLLLSDRSPRLEFVGEGAGLRLVGSDLVVPAGGARAVLRCSDAYRVVRTSVSFAPGSPARGAAEPVRLERGADGATVLVFGAMPAGSHRLEIELEEVAEGGHRLPQQLALRVLPDVLELRVPAATSRFLPGVLDVGLLVLNGATGKLREGPHWSIDPDLRPYLRGTLWVGSELLVPLPLPIPERGAPLLPEIAPIAGHNVLAVELRDVLERPVRVLVGDQPGPRREFQGHTVDVVADFWWNEDPPEPVGEELLVEHGQPARLRLRMPLPYTADDLAGLLLGLGASEIPATQVAADGAAASIVTFELKPEVWSAAAKLDGVPREDFAKAIERSVRAYVLTPMGPFNNLDLRVSTTRSTLRPVGIAELGDAPGALADIRLVPVLAMETPFAEPVPQDAPPRALFRPQPAVVVRNVGDFLLQDRELSCGEARALVAAAEPLLAGVDASRLVHHDDPLGAQRLRGPALLPAHVATAAADQPLAGVDYFQAYTCCRLLGLVIGGDPELFRLPLGCELELAAFGAAAPRACNGPAAARQPVLMAEFRAAAERLSQGALPTAADSRRAGDVVQGAFGAWITGLDFGVREWVADLPFVAGEEPLLGEWIKNHAEHLQHLAAFASGEATPPDVLAVPLRTFGIVRGLALGELDGLLGPSGQILDPASLAEVPPSVPGVLRTEQLRRDGRDLLSSGPDPRLARIGFRVAGTAALLARLRGQR